MKKIAFFLVSLLVVTIPPLGAEDKEEPSETEASKSSSRSPIKGMAQGVKKVAYEGPKDFAKETVSEIPKKQPLAGVVEGVNKGTEKLLDHTIKGAYKVATLGMSELESYEVQEPEKGSGEPTKFKISIPGT